MNPIQIYLAGGMNSNWQAKLMEKFGKGFIYFNPKDHLLEISSEYTPWDLFYVMKCDILFAYMEKNNPSGIGLSLEVGYAKALGKTIILVDEKSSSDEFFKEKFKIVRDSATIVFDNLSLGLEYLSSFLRIKTSNEDVSFKSSN